MRRERALARFRRLDRKRRRYAMREAFGLWRRAWMGTQVGLQRASVHWRVQCVHLHWRRWRAVQEAAARRAEEDAWERRAAAAARLRRSAEAFRRAWVLRQALEQWRLEAQDAVRARCREREHELRRERLLQAVAGRVRKQQEDAAAREAAAAKEQAAAKARGAAGARGRLWKRNGNEGAVRAPCRAEKEVGAEGGGRRATDTWTAAPHRRPGTRAEPQGGEPPLLRLTDSAELELDSILSRHRQRGAARESTGASEPADAGGATTGMEARTRERQRRREQLRRRYEEAAEQRRSERQAREARVEAEAAVQHEELLGSRRRARADAELERQERECRAALAREQTQLARLHRGRVLLRSLGWAPWLAYMDIADKKSTRAARMRPRTLKRAVVAALRAALVARRQRAVLRELQLRGSADAVAWRNRAARGLQAFMFHFILCFSRRQAELHYASRLLLAGLRGLLGACGARRAQLGRAAKYCRFRRMREPLVGWFLTTQRAREDWRRQEASLLFRAAAWAKHHAQWRAFHSWRRRLRSRRLRRFIADFHEDLLLEDAAPPAGGGEAASPGGEPPAVAASAVSEELRALEAQAAAPFEEIGAVLAALDKDIAAVWGDSEDCGPAMDT